MIRHFLRALPFAILVGVLSGVEARMGRCVLTDHRTGGRHRTQSVFTQRESSSVATLLLLICSQPSRHMDGTAPPAG